MQNVIYFRIEFEMFMSCELSGIEFPNKLSNNAVEYRTVRYGTVPYSTVEGGQAIHLGTVREYWPGKKSRVYYGVRARDLINVRYVGVHRSRCY